MKIQWMALALFVYSSICSADMITEDFMYNRDTMNANINLAYPIDVKVTQITHYKETGDFAATIEFSLNMPCDTFIGKSARGGKLNDERIFIYDVFTVKSSVRGWCNSASVPNTVLTTTIVALPKYPTIQFGQTVLELDFDSAVIAE